jgi:endonuclease III
VKAQQIIQAAEDIVRMGGEVPETSAKLQKVTGIGPKLAGILTRVNTRALYCSEDRRQVIVTDEVLYQ